MPSLLPSMRRALATSVLAPTAALLLSSEAGSASRARARASPGCAVSAADAPLARIRSPADPPTVEEIIAVMRTAGDAVHGRRLRGLIGNSVFKRNGAIGQGNDFRVLFAPHQMVRNHAREGGAVFFVGNDRSGVLEVRSSTMWTIRATASRTDPGIFFLGREQIVVDSVVGWRARARGRSSDR